MKYINEAACGFVGVMECGNNWALTNRLQKVYVSNETYDLLKHSLSFSRAAKYWTDENGDKISVLL
jgi:hypothetical protein